MPQFWNVLKGEMSLVGPRPEMPFFVDKFKKELPYYTRRLVIRPGLTGWNQIHYRNYQESIEEITHRLKHDFYYIENMSLQLDIEIIIRTVIRVFKGHGQA
jgi:lipopolysaccharide/colanic/teichoic acid biosynthesis glycosyltransferase